MLKKQAEDQRQQLHKVEEQLATAREQIETQKKELEKKEEAIARAEQNGYDIEVKETEDILWAQVTGFCRRYCLQVWTEALNLTGVSASSDLRKTENIFYLLALCITTQPNSQETTALKAPGTAQLADAGTFKAVSGPSKEPGKDNIKAKEKEANKDKAPKHSKSPLATKEASKEKEVAKDKAFEPSSQSTAKANPPPPANR